jgi:hypothetical protein
MISSPQRSFHVHICRRSSISGELDCLAGLENGKRSTYGHEPLPIEKLPDKLRPRIFHIRPVTLASRGLIQTPAREQRAALDINQPGRHSQPFAGQRQIDLLAGSQELQVIVANRCDGEPPDIDVACAHEMEQQVKRPFKGWKLQYVLSHPSVTSHASPIRSKSGPHAITGENPGQDKNGKRSPGMVKSGPESIY